VLRECLEVAGDWLAVGLDTRPDRLAAYPWHRPAPPSLVELAGELVDLGVHRLVLSQGGARPDLAFLSGLTRTLRADIFVAGGSVDLDAIKGLRDASFAALLVAGCSTVIAPSPSPTAMPTIAPSAPAYTLGPTPSGCPTSAPAAMTAGTTATVTMTTNFGNIVIKVVADDGPNAAGAFLALARCGYYDNLIFQRIIAGFVIQAGDGQYARLPSLDPDKFGLGGPGWTITDDKVSAAYKRGTLAIANTGAVNSGGSQFFIVLSDTNTLAQTTPGYAIFGSVTTGMDVVDKIAGIPVGGAPKNGNAPDMALQPAVITSTTVTTP
jgi:cyclophilin family peptidyl-prolyl cis-trans isomerase